MQALIALPSAQTLAAGGEPKAALGRKVCGIPLLVRVLETAARSGATSFLLVQPDTLPGEIVQRCLRSRRLSPLPVEIVPFQGEFDAESAADWKLLDARLKAKFLWLPWNAVLDKRRLSPLLEAGQKASEGARFQWDDPARTPGAEPPLVVVKSRLGTAADGSLARYAGETEVAVKLPSALSQPVWNRRQAHEAEEDLLRWSGKDWDGIFSKFNRRLCWPFMRVLWRTPISPNVVTFAGLAVAILCGYFYAQGHWLAYTAGAIFYFAAVLFDEMDGMLARLTFRDSAFGCRLETWVDFASYVLLYGGIIIGLYRESGRAWLVVGGLLFFGIALSIRAVHNQRKLATEPDKPHEYQIILYETLEENSADLISRNSRNLQFLIKKAVMCHHLLVFSVLGLLKVYVVLSAIGANLVWIFAGYVNRYFTAAPGSRRPLASKAVLSADQTGGSV